MNDSEQRTTTTDDNDDVIMVIMYVITTERTKARTNFVRQSKTENQETRNQKPKKRQ